MARTRSLKALAVAAAALYASVLATPVLAVEDFSVTGFIDAPTTGTPLGAGQPFTVTGWMVDRSARGWAGIDEVSISVQQPGQSPLMLGQARIAQARPDVGSFLGDPDWSASGYSLQVPGLAPGSYDLIVNAHTSQGWVARIGSLMVAEPNTTVQKLPSGSTWSAYGFNINAPASVWPMLEVLHRHHFDWALDSLGKRGTPIVWTELPTGVLGSYDPTTNVIKLSNDLQRTSLEGRTAVLAHELTHLNDDLNGKLATWNADTCFAAETRAFVTEANLWHQLFGPMGKQPADDVETQENRKMWAFAGNPRFADLVVRTTASYVTECGAT